MTSLTLTADQALARATGCIEQGDYAAARVLCDAVLAAEAEHPRALCLLGTVAFENDDPRRAVELFERAIAADPALLDPYDYLKAAYLALDQPADAGRVEERTREARVFAERFGALPRTLRHYQGMVESLRKSPYLDYPRELAIETMTVCNAACSFCPYPQLERKGERMPDALIEKIIRDLEDVPRELTFAISPFKVNDPLLDVRIFDILERCNERLPNAALRMFTNASALTAKHVDRLARVRNLQPMWISLNHHDPQRYEQIMQLPWQRTIERMDVLHRAVAAGQFRVPVRVSRVADGSADDKAFATFVRERFPLFMPLLVAQSTWLGQVEGLNSLEQVEPVGCGRWFELSITSTGQVAFCCMDGKDEYPIGDVSTSHVLEVYNSPGFRSVRERFVTRKEGMPCSLCTNR